MSQQLAIKNNHLPAYDGFDMTEADTRIIRGQMIKQVDGRNTCGGMPFPNDRPMLVADVAQGAQCWLGGTLAESRLVRPDQPSIFIDDLNASIPKKEWSIGLDGQPRPPWQWIYVVYLIDEADGSSYTMLNSTTGMKIAYANLCEKTNVMRALKKSRVTPVVTIGSVSMKTKYGTKLRPEFIVVGWKGINADQQPLLKAVEPPTASEITNDSLPPWDDPLPF